MKRATGPRRPTTNAGSAPASGPGRWAQSWATVGTTRTKRVLALGAVALALLVLLGRPMSNWWQQRQQIDSLRAQVVSQEKDVAQLQKEQARWKDEAYVVSQARERLKFVKVGETAYTVIDAEPKHVSDPSLATAPRSGDSPWYGRLWASVEVADAPAAQR